MYFDRSIILARGCETLLILGILVAEWLCFVCGNEVRYENNEADLKVRV